jgi:hypothetical protein
VFALKFCKKCQYDEKQKQYGYKKNAEFDADFESVEKFSKS